MKRNLFQVGLFVAVSLVLFVMLALQLSKGGGKLLFKPVQEIIAPFNQVTGISRNTPVLVAGVNVGLVTKIRLNAASGAELVLHVQNDICIPRDSSTAIKTTGVIGDAYVELALGSLIQDCLKSGETLGQGRNYGDFNSVTNQIGDIADDVKAITAHLRTMIVGQDSTVTQTLKNIEAISKTLKHLTTAREKELDSIVMNLRDLSHNLNMIVQHNAQSVNQSLANINDVTSSIAKGEGTVGRLVKDEATIEKLHATLDQINKVFGGVNRTQFDLGMHTEFLGGTGDFKNYVQMAIKPRPDKYFLFQAVSDPDPSFNTHIEETTVTSGATTTSINTTRHTKDLNGFLFSAQLAKRFREFTLRGGLIESSGGVGIDFNRGPFGLSFDAFDFKDQNGQKPHLKLMGTAQVTNSFYVLSGLDDIINPNQDLAWFMGAGLNFTDDDIKSLFGLMSLGAR